MVATKLSELAGKGWGWYGAPSSKENKHYESATTPPSASAAAPASSSVSLSTRLSELASHGWGWSTTANANATAVPLSTETNDTEPTKAPSTPLAKSSLTSSLSSTSLQQAAQSAYSGISNVYSSVSSLYVPSLGLPGSRRNNPTTAAATAAAALNSPSTLAEEDIISASSTSMNSHNSRRRRKSLLSPTLLGLMNNPYIGVRGGGRLHRAKPPHESMDAVRKLLYVVDDDHQKQKGGGGVMAAASRRLSSHTVHFDPQEDENQNSMVQGHTDVTIPLKTAAPLTPLCRPSVPSTKTTSTSTTLSTADSSTATPRHRNTAMEGMAGNANAMRDRQELPMQTFLSQQLSTIDSVSMDHPQHEGQAASIGDPDRAETNTTTSIVPEEGKSSASSHSPEETASQLTEGTLRAMRDLALDEALELHNSLKYWSDRWERPVFSWFVAGPWVWFDWIQNKRGYDHALMVGQRVSQIQAVLARRLLAIGELQHHLLRAGWQRGVAHWGFLGEGGNWAAVDGTDGRMGGDDDDSSHHSLEDSDHEGEEEDEEDFHHPDDYQEPQHPHHEESEHFFAEDQYNAATNAIHNNNSSIKPLDLHQPPSRNHRYRLLRRDFSEASFGSGGALHMDLPPPPPLPSLSSSSPRKASSSRFYRREDRRNPATSLYYTNLHVRKRNGGGHIQKDGPALAEWSIDALALVRSQLIRAANGKLSLPCSENWPFEHVTGNSSLAAGDEHQNGMPAWAGIKYVSSSSTGRSRTRMESRGSCFSITEHANNNNTNNNNNNEDFPNIGVECFDNQSLVGDEELSKEQHHQQQSSPPKRRSPSQPSVSSVKERAVVGISNLPLMMSEISSLLDVMEDIMDIQRARRLEKLKPPPWWRQHWFLVILGPPSMAYLLYNNLVGQGQTWKLCQWAAKKLMDFAREHVVLPCYALYDEFTKGPESISDHAARDTATETLKKMIRSWLDETCVENLSFVVG